MNILRRLRALVMAMALMGAFGAPSALGATSGDSLYVGDGSDNTVKQFDASSGSSQGVFIPTTAGLLGPRGILHLSNGTFLVANQNVGQPYPGEIDQFSSTGASLGALVPRTSPHAPFAPRGIVLGPDNRTLYVADLGEAAIGRVETYDVTTGTFRGNLNFDRFANSSASNGEFHPRGLVFGPDGRLYLSLFDEASFPRYGWILSYDLGTGDVRVVANNGPNASPGDCAKYLNGPEGLTFGPSGGLYVVGRRLNTGAADDFDRILVFDGATGACLDGDTIPLDGPTGPDAYGRALIFGPSGYLFLPVTFRWTPGGADVGGIRRYNVSTKTFTDFVSPVTDQGQIASWWYLTFGQTNPATLAYQG